MKLSTAVGFICLVAALAVGCSAASRHNVLSRLFDGVPPLAPAAEPGQARPEARVAAAGQRIVGYQEHGPYAARLCNACHEAGATNALMAPPDELCFKCHNLRLDRKYIHGPLASGGCLVCHDPHSSQYRYLLVSESDGFCSHCHAKTTIEKVSAHLGAGERCTTCHDAHMSDRAFLLK